MPKKRIQSILHALHGSLWPTLTNIKCHHHRKKLHYSLHIIYIYIILILNNNNKMWIGTEKRWKGKSLRIPGRKFKKEKKKIIITWYNKTVIFLNDLCLRERNYSFYFKQNSLFCFSITMLINSTLCITLVEHKIKGLGCETISTIDDPALILLMFSTNIKFKTFEYLILSIITWS